MFQRWIFVCILCVFVAGCSTAQSPTNVNKLQIKVSHLERKLAEKDEQIKELKYELDELATQVEDSGGSHHDYDFADFDDDQDYSEPVEDRATTIKNLGIIRVKASAKDVQKALKGSGYYKGAIDGKLGRGSKRAIKEFQKDHGLVADGVVGRKTWSELKNYLE